MPTILITGANRGIGLEHARQALAAGETVIAACRAPSRAAELQQLSSQYGASMLRVEELDVASAKSTDALAARFKGVAIDVLINNAGIYGKPGQPSWPDGASIQSLDGMDYDFWEETLRINLLGPFRVTARLMPNLHASERRLVVMMSSDLGSIGNNTMGSSHIYRSSKAALNMITRGLAIDLKSQGVTIVSMAPGWTKTDLGGAGAQWAVADSVKGQRDVIAKLSIADSGQFIDLTGKIVAW